MRLLTKAGMASTEERGNVLVVGCGLGTMT